MKIQIISSSIREGRESHKVALYLENWLKNNTNSEVGIIDLKERNYPLFEERLSYMKTKHKGAQEFSDEIKNADAIIIVVPEYNGGYPASIKNVVDLLYDEWQNKAIALAPVSGGVMAGAQVAQQLQFVLYKIGANVIKERFHVGQVQDNFTDSGKSNNDELFDKNAKSVFEGLKNALEK